MNIFNIDSREFPVPLFVLSFPFNPDKIDKSIILSMLYKIYMVEYVY